MKNFKWDCINCKKIAETSIYYFRWILDGKVVCGDVCYDCINKKEKRVK